MTTLRLTPVVTRTIKPKSPLDVLTSGEPCRAFMKRAEEGLKLEVAARITGFQSVYLRRLLTAAGQTVEDGKIRWRQLYEIRPFLENSTTILTPEHFYDNGAFDALQEYIEKTIQQPVQPIQIGVEGNVISGVIPPTIFSLPGGSVKTVITSPPYWGTRVYEREAEAKWSDGTVVAFGGEDRPEDYVRHTAEILLALWRILEPRGTIWWNVGDTYNTRTQIRRNSVERLRAMQDGDELTWRELPHKRHSAGHRYLKDKDLCMIPPQVAIAAQRLGYWVRSWITWDKQNSLPETVEDRPSVGHETILLISKSRHYDFFKDAWLRLPPTLGGRTPAEPSNLRTVWRFATSAGKEGHGATFPMELPGRCIALSTRPGDLVLDPFAGAGTTLIAAKALGRRYLGVDCSPQYVEIARHRLRSINQKRHSLDEWKGT